MRHQAVVVSLILVAAACRHEKVVLNPDKGKQTQREITHGEAPGGTVQSTAGAPVDLATLWEGKRVVLVFYRGGWCPHCKKQLAELAQHQGKIEEAGAVVAAISSDSVEDAKALQTSLGLRFALYSDASLGVITKWGVDDYANGISKPATFVIEPGGAISYKKVGERPDDHPTIGELMAALE